MNYIITNMYVVFNSHASDFVAKSGLFVRKF